jgi:sulfate permease, SulP family
LLEKFPLELSFAMAFIERMPVDLHIPEAEAKPDPLLSLKRFRRPSAEKAPEGPSRGHRNAPLRWFPLLDFIRSSDRRSLIADARAGLNVALLDFPQGMAYALIAGLPFFMGIYASAVAALVGPLLASSRFIMLGPTNAIAVLTLSGFLSLNFTQEEAIAAMPLMLLMVSALMLLGGLLRFANLINYVSRTVVTGYITAAACLIIIKQLKNVLGVETARTATFFDSAVATFAALPATHLPTLALSGLTILTYLVLQRTLRTFPNVALTLALSYFAARFFESEGWAIQPLSEVSLPSGQWPLSLPVFSFELMGQLAGPAMAVAFLSLLESSSIAKTLGAKSGDTVDINQQMLSMGAANFGCAFFSGMPISGSLTRSALNFNSGARSPLSSIFSGLLLAVGILLLAPYMADIPMASLSALVILVGLSLFNKTNIRIALGSTNSDAAVFLTTFISGLLFPLDTAIYFGVGMSVFLFMRKAGTPEMVEFAFRQSGQEVVAKTERPAIALLHVDGDLFFGSADIFLEQARRVTADDNLRVIILRLRNAHNLDATCAMAIDQLVRFAHEKKRSVIVSGAHPEVVKVLRNSDLLPKIGLDNVFREDPENPTLSTSLALRRARQIIGSSAEVRLFVRDTEEEKYAPTEDGESTTAR